jgi:phosphoribosylanthranilate isomerase
MLVKICGITRAEDAEAAVALGAAAVGFVFWPKSPRFVDPFRARAIAASLPAFVTPVGVFVNQPVDYIDQVASLVRLGAVQLHGDEEPDDAVRLKCPVIKAVTAGSTTVDRWPALVTLLVDAHDPVVRGGTGRTADWSAAAALAARRRVVLAGGLTADNIGEAIDRVQPYGVDVSSGVESAPGIKDRRKLEDLFKALSRVKAHQ